MCRRAFSLRVSGIKKALPRRAEGVGVNSGSGLIFEQMF